MAEETENVEVENTDTNETSEQESKQVNPLEISDEDIANMNFPTDDESTESGDEESNEDESDDEDEEVDDDSTDEDDSSEEEFDESDDEESEDSDDETDDKDTADEESTDDTDDSTDDEIEEEADTSSEAFKVAEYDKLMQPFTANGHQIQIKSVDDAITLMQMGANYNKKMASLKPNLKLLKMLDNNDLLDEGKLSYLIDLDKKNPEAITKLIKDSGINPLDVDVEKDTEYTPNTYNVGDNEVELDNVLESIKDTPSYKQTVEIISTKWDESSRRVLVKNPNAISVINAQVSNGIYEKINTEVEQQRMLGKLNGMSDIEAYLHIGKELHDAGKLGEQKPAPKPKPSNTTTTKKVARKPDDSKLKKRKKAASTTRSTAGKKPNQNFNPLSMSDEEFEKAANSRYM